MVSARQSQALMGASRHKRRPAARRMVVLAVTILVLSAVLAVALSTVASAYPSTSTLYQETDGRLVFNKTWSTSAYWQYSGGGEKYTYAAGGCVYAPFAGVSLDWVTKTAANLGIALVSVDGAAPVEVDLYSPTTVYKKTVWSTGDLTPGLHVVKITRSGTRNPNSSGTAITLDALKVVGSLVWPNRYQENNVAVHASAGWTTAWSTNFSGGKMKVFNPSVVEVGSLASAGSESTSSGAQLAFLPGAVVVPFNGVKLNLIATKGRSYGKVWVSVDDGTRVLVDLYSYSLKYKQAVYSTGFLAPGSHYVTIQWSGQKNPYSLGTKVDVDAFDITGNLGVPN
jgi:hypothetical protein